MHFRYNPEKNALLLRERGIGFDQIIEEIENGKLLQITYHHNQTLYPKQKIFHVQCLDKVYLVPYIVESDGSIFLKTVYPSRKATKKLLTISKEGHNESQSQ
ncbi:MAG: hypothetical protein RLZ35_829 [Pseudomonadota bacterium]|jgi:hypothetical protein